MPTSRAVSFAASQKPMLMVVIDCEEDFDWRHPMRGTRYSLASTQRLERVSDLFSEHGMVPIYAVGYPIVNDDIAWKHLARLREQGRCHIGAHLHPWVTPPYREVSNRRNSFPGNLPPELELAKLRVLTDRIQDRFGDRPAAYKAGRYGFGAGTVAALRELGYSIDLSFMPHWDYKAESGPAFLQDMAAPFWLDDERTLLEIPSTAGFTGAARQLGPRFYSHINATMARRLRAPAILARTGILNRVRLSPEGVRIDEARALTRSLLADGHLVFQVSFHSTSLVPGSAPYVGDERALDLFMQWLRDYLMFFRTEIGGVMAVPEQVLAAAQSSDQAHDGAPDRPLTTGVAGRARMQVLMCCNAGYIQHLAVVVLSLAAQPTKYGIDILVVMAAPDEGDIAALQDSLLRFPHVTLRTLTFTPDPDLFLPIRGHYSRDMYTRLWVAEFFDVSVLRVLYLDSDMVVTGSLDELWETDLRGNTIGAVTIPGSTRCALLNIPEEYGYFNSGVLLIDLAQWRQRDIFPKLLDFIEHNSEKLPDGDQDVLNAMMHGDRFALDFVWNAISPFYFDYHDLRLPEGEVPRIQAGARIVHFNGASKPWSYFSRHPRRADYYKYLRLTPWRDFTPPDRTILNRLRRAASSLMPSQVRRFVAEKRKAGGIVHSTHLRDAPEPREGLGPSKPFV